MNRDRLPIVDAHHQLWDLDGPIRYPWLDGQQRSYLPMDYRRDTALHKFIAAVLIGAARDSTQQLAETAWLSRIAAETGMPNAIVAHASVGTPDAEDVIAEQAANPLVRGIRTEPLLERTRGLALLEKYDLSWDLCVPWHQLEAAALVCREHPDLRIVLNHAGCPLDRSQQALRVWKRGMEALSCCPNVWCKISGLSVAGQNWTLQSNGALIRETIGMFGVDRCMFASNVPVETGTDWIYGQFKYVTAGLPEADRRKLFAENAIAFYRIALPPPAVSNGAIAGGNADGPSR